MNDITDNNILPKTEMLEKVLKLAKTNAEAIKYRNVETLVMDLQNGFLELATLSDNSLFVETDSNGKGFTVRPKESIFTRANDYIYVSAKGAWSEIEMEIRLFEPDGTEVKETYVIIRNSLNDALILKSKQEKPIIISETIVLDDLFYEKVAYNFLTKVYASKSK